jgi:hypothetical protein
MPFFCLGGFDTPNPEFWQTPMGQRFYEGTLPELIRAINELAKSMDKLSEVLERKSKTEV